MVSKFFVLTTSITKGHKTTYSFWVFLKNLLQSVTNRESFTNFKTVITKCEKRLLQSVGSIKKCDNYQKVRRNKLLI